MPAFDVRFSIAAREGMAYTFLMPQPLIAKGSTDMSFAGHVVAFIALGVPLFAFWYFYDHGRVIHFANPWLNLGAHAALFIIPMTWVGLMFAKPVVYEAPSDNIMISTSHILERLRHGWWAMFVLWATPVVAVVVVGHALLTRELAHPEILSTSLGKAVGIFAVVFCLGLFYCEMFSGKDQPAVWISDEGLRTSIARFHEWKNIHHMSRRGIIYELFNNANRAIPVSVFEVSDPNSRALLERQLAQHHIRIADDPSPLFATVKIGVILGFMSIIAFSLWLRFYLSFSFISVVLISFGIGIVLTLVFEKIRGVSKFGYSKPRVEFSDGNDDSENYDDDDEDNEDDIERDTPKPTV
jgi:hypothetical protein